MADQPKAKMKLRFGKTELANLFTEPQEGPIEFSVRRTKNFGARGTLELRGDTGGQTIAIPIYVIASDRGDVDRKYHDLISALGTNETLEIEVTSHTNERHKIAHKSCTFEQVIPQTPYMYDMSGAMNDGRKNSCYRVYLLMFYKLDANVDK